LNITAKTDVGRARELNQDAYAVRELPGLAWAAVCDGMGGPAGGEIASELAAHTMQEFFDASLHAESTTEELVRAIAAGINAANARIFETGERNAQLSGMGTTLALAVVQADRLTVAHVGDSRVYLLQGDTLHCLTRDHSLVQELLDVGEITQEELRAHPQKNVITRALGVAPKVQYDLVTQTMADGDVLLLCTDGLTNACTDDEIADLLRAAHQSNAPEALIQLANARGGGDNITAVTMNN
jgi:protein phosphatase